MGRCYTISLDYDSAPPSFLNVYTGDCSLKWQRITVKLAKVTVQIVRRVRWLRGILGGCASKGYQIFVVDW